MSGEVLPPGTQLGVQMVPAGVVTGPPLAKCLVPDTIAPVGIGGGFTFNIDGSVNVSNVIGFSDLPACVLEVDWSFRTVYCTELYTSPEPPGVLTFTPDGASLTLLWSVLNYTDTQGWIALLRPRGRVDGWGWVELGQSIFELSVFCARDPTDFIYPNWYAWDFPDGLTFACGAHTTLRAVNVYPTGAANNTDCGLTAQFVITPLTPAASAMPLPTATETSPAVWTIFIDSTTASGDIQFEVTPKFQGRPFGTPFTISATC